MSALVNHSDTNKLHDIAHLDKEPTATQASNLETAFAKDLVYTVSSQILSFKKR